MWQGKEARHASMQWDEFLPCRTQLQAGFKMESLAINLGKYIECMAALSISMFST